MLMYQLIMILQSTTLTVEELYPENIETITLVIHKALYGLKLIGQPWHTKNLDDLQHMEFSSCKAELGIWMRKSVFLGICSNLYR